MIVVEARIQCNPGKRDDFITQAQPSIEATQKEEGCLHYELLKSTIHQDHLLYYERWADRDALKKHAESKHMGEWKNRREELGLVSEPPTVIVYDIAPAAKEG